MCLLTEDKRCKVADAPIACYKIVIKQDGTKFMSDIYCFPYELREEPYKLGPLADFPKSNPRWKESKMMYIHEGFHSFKRLKDAREYCDPDTGVMPDDCAGSEVILRCEIPKGAHYWTGNRNLGTGGYAEFCSDQLRVVAWKMRDDNCWRKHDKNRKWKNCKNPKKPCV